MLEDEDESEEDESDEEESLESEDEDDDSELDELLDRLDDDDGKDELLELLIGAALDELLIGVIELDELTGGGGAALLDELIGLALDELLGVILLTEDELADAQVMLAPVMGQSGFSEFHCAMKLGIPQEVSVPGLDGTSVNHEITPPLHENPHSCRSPQFGRTTVLNPLSVPGPIW